jgi:protein-L-isoaspartate(D-aspartate) O-methyltransferase
METTAADLGNVQMVDRLIAAGALWSPGLIAAFRATPRHAFLDRIFLFQRRRNRWREILTRESPGEHVELLYSDRALITGLSPGSRDEPPVPISSSSQPSLMAQMLEDLRLEPGMQVLEIGTGTGYNAALMAHVAGPGNVTTVDVDRDVLSRAWDHLRAFPEREIHLYHADGRAGYPEDAPYDRIIVTAAAFDIESAWLEQLNPGGLIVAPLVLAPGLEFVVRGTVLASRFDGRLTRAAYFMPLRAEGETGASLSDIPPEGAGSSMPAPWAGWFDRRRLRTSWLGFSQALAVFAFVHGHTIHYRNTDNGPHFGIADSSSSHWCWLGQDEWQCSGDGGRELAWTLWHEFVEAGGPWPTEYRFEACPAGTMTAGVGTYLRQSPRSQQRWRLVEPRERAGWI